MSRYFKAAPENYKNYYYIIKLKLLLYYFGVKFKGCYRFKGPHRVIISLMRARRVSISSSIYIFTGAQPEIFQGRGGFAELVHFIKNFVKNTRKMAPQGNCWSLFS